MMHVEYIYILILEDFQNSEIYQFMIACLNMPTNINYTSNRSEIILFLSDI